MASLREDINKNLEKIEKNTRKKFGTKMPSSDNLEQEQTEQQLSYEQMIMGSLASMIWGQKNRLKDTEVRSLIGRGNTIFDLVKSIKVNTNVALRKSQEYIDKQNKAINVNVKNIESLAINALVEALFKGNNRLESMLKDVNDINRLIKIFGNKQLKIILDNIDTIKTTLDDNNRILNNFDAIILSKGNKDNEGAKNDQNNKIQSTTDLEKITIRLDAINTLITKNIIEEILKNQIKSINSIRETIKDTSNFTGLLRGVTVIKESISNIEKSIKDTSKFSEILGGISEINKSINDINETIKNVSKFPGLLRSVSKINESINESFKTVNTNIESILNKIPESLVIDNNINQTDELSKHIVSLIDAIKDDTKEIRSILASDTIDELIIDGLCDISKFAEKILNKIPEELNVTSSNATSQIDIKITGDGFKDIQSLIEQIKKVELDDVNTNVLTSINNVLNIVKSLNETSIKNDVNGAKKSLGEVNSIFTGGKNNLQEIITNINNTFDKLNSLEKDGKLEQSKVLNIVSNVLNIFKSLNENIGDIKVDDAQASIKKINNLLKNSTLIDTEKKKDDASIPALIANINNLFGNIDDKDFNNLNKNAGNFSTVLDSIIAAVSIDPKTIKKAGLQELINLTANNEKGLTIRALLKNLQETTEDVKINYKSLDGLQDFFEAMSSIGEIGLIKRIRIRSNIKYFAKYLKKSLPSLMETLQEAAKKTEDKKNIEAMGAIGTFFDSIVKIAEYDREKRRKLAQNLAYIRKYVIEDLVEIVKDIKEAIQGSTEGSAKVLQSLSDFFDKIFKVTDFSLFKLVKLSIKLDYLVHDIIEDQIASGEESLIGIINKIDTDTAEKRLDMLNGLFDLIHSMDEKILSFKQAALMTARLNIIESDVFPVIQDIINRIDEINKLNSPDFESLNSLINNIDTLIKNINSTESLKIKSMFNVLKLCGYSLLLFETINLLNKKKSDSQQISQIFNVLNTIIDNLNTTSSNANSLEQISGDVFKNIQTFILFVSELRNVNENIENYIKSTNWDVETIKQKLDELKKVLDEIPNIKTALDGIKFDEEDEDKVKRIFKVLNKLNKISKLSILASASAAGMKALSTTADMMKEIIDKFADVDKKDVDKSITIVRSFMTMVAMSGAILLLGGLIMSLVDVRDLLMFTVTLSAFMFAISFVMKRIAKTLKEDIEGAKGACQLIAVSAAILLIGSIVIKLINPEELILFTATLAGFLFMIGAVFAAFSDGFKESLEGAEDAALLITVAGGILILGGLFMHLINYGDLFLFAVTLAGFLGLIGLIFVGVNKLGDTAFNGAKEAAILIAAAGGILVLGGLFMRWISILDLLAFAVTLAAFIGGIVTIFAIFGKAIKKSIANAMGLAYLVVITGATLLVGAAIMSEHPELYEHLFLFGLILLGFIGVLTWALNNKKIKTSIPTAIALGILVAISAAVLLIGASFLKDWGWEGALAVTGFAILLFGFIWLMSKAMGMLTKSAKNLFLGIVLTALLGAVVYGFVYIFKQIVDIANSITNFNDIWATVGIIGAVISGMLVICGIVGIPAVAAFVALGEVVLAGLCGVVYLISKVIREAIDTMKYAQSIDYNQLNGENIKAIINTLADVADAVTPFYKYIIKLPLAAKAMHALNEFLGDAASIVKSWAAFSVPMYDSSGKLTGYKTLSQQDIKDSSEHIKTVVTTLFDTVKKIYDDNSTLFEFNLGSIFSGGTIFSKVANSGQALGKMLSIMADAIREWADLKIPVYGNGTKITGYKTIDDKAFDAAADNISKVVVTLARSIIRVYYTKLRLDDGTEFEGSKLFDAQGFLGLGDTPFARVVKSIKPMGDMLVNLAKGIQAWADMKIPVYGEGTNITKYLDLSSPNTFNKVGENIGNVVSALGKAIVKVYAESEKNDNLKGMFKAASWTGIGDSVFAKVVKAIKPMGDMLVNLAKGIQSWADMKIPTYDTDGKVNGYISLSDGDLTAVGENIKSVVTALGQSIVDVYNSEKGEKLFKNDKVLKAITLSINNIGKTLVTVSSIIKQYATGEFPSLEWRDGKLNTVTDSKFKLDPKSIKKMKENVKAVVMALAGALYGVYYSKVKIGNKVISAKELFEESGLFTKKDAPAVVIANSIKLMSTTLKSVIDCIKYIEKSELDNLVPKLDTIKSNLSEIMKHICGMFVLFTEEGTWHFTAGEVEFKDEIALVKWFKKQDTAIKTSDNYIKSFSKRLISIIETIAKVSGTYSKYQEQLQGLSENNMTNDIYKAVSSCVDTMYSVIKDIKLSNDNDIQRFLNSVKSFTEIINKINEAEKFNATVRVLKEGILGIYETTQNIQNIALFDQHVKQLNDYVKAINQVNLKNLGELNNFVNSMNQLSARLGNLDKLTDALANKLSAVLYELVLQLRKADASIKNAHELQKRRKQLIDESMSKIQRLMDKHMIVEISQSTNDTPEDGTINQTPGTTPDNTGGTPPLNSPETATVETGNTNTGTAVQAGSNNSGSSTGRSNNHDTLTRTEFIRLMQANLSKLWNT